MSKKKTTSQDFLNLLSDQEEGSEKMAFTPVSSKRRRKMSKPRLSPIQKELIDFVIQRTPKSLTQFISSDLADQIATRLGVETQLKYLINRSRSRKS
jgi:hypothetical protein